MNYYHAAPGLQNIVYATYFCYTVSHRKQVRRKSFSVSGLKVYQNSHTYYIGCIHFGYTFLIVIWRQLMTVHRDILGGEAHTQQWTSTC